MSNSVPGRRWRGLVVAAALTMLVAVPGVVSADTGVPPPTIYPAESRDATITISTSAAVTARLVATIHVEYTCEPFELFDWNTGETTMSTEGRVEFSSVQILQVAGRTINFGSAEGVSAVAVCDGTTVNRSDAAVVAQVVPWKTGTAIAGARVHIASVDFASSHFASTGPVQIRLGR